MVFSLTKLFPHFHRINPARLLFSLEIVLLWGGLLAVITINALAIRTSRPAYWHELMNLFSSPYSVSRHIDLAFILWRQGQKPIARELMISAQSYAGTVQSTALGNTVNVLGSSPSPMDTLSQWEQEGDLLKNRYTHWQTVAAAKPDYRDALVTLAVLAFQLGKLDESRRWVRQALVLDPNDPTTRAFAQFLQEK